ncbi:hypothetical protein [Haloarcula sp. Atlit-7R]|uniref:hypothetical protein n=1 Tax=Haloarcula sp. Atlit-7R TaxID=2282125 RepID=UPI000EF14132|nr:hypothetical protein [Haloarcula sp. Atlit-7R]RLM94383.1 hypothetical protein D3D01_16095 [Haloarcula sp. Atlit-7R]
MSKDFRDTISSDIHGLEIDAARKCDYCGEDIETRSPVQCEVAKLGTMPNLRTILASSPLPNPDGWELDALRCRDCELDTLSLETDGFDEALVMLNIADTAGQVTADASELRLVDVSKDGSGYHPPKINLQVLIQYQDVGLVRWSRIEGLLGLQDNSNGDVSEVVEKIKEGAVKGKEVPPEVAPLLN